MAAHLEDLAAFVAVARAGGFRDASRASGASASSLSEAVRRLEGRLGVRLLNRTTRSVAPTEAGARLLDRLTPALVEVESALEMVNSFRDRPAGTLRLNVPVAAARLVLPRIVPTFLAAYPDIRLEVIVEDRLVDILAAGCDAGIRYEEHLEKDMIAVPIGPRVQRFATAASPAYLKRHGRPNHPRKLLDHACLRGRFEGRAMPTWEFERRRSGGKSQSHRSAHCQHRRRNRPYRRGSGRRQRHHLFVRGLAASSSRQWVLEARAGTLVAALLGTVSLLPEPSPASHPASRLRRFHRVAASISLRGADVFAVSHAWICPSG